MKQNDRENNNKIKKSAAKAVGVKSLARLSDGSTVVSSFGKGAAAELESLITGGEIRKLSDKAILEITDDTQNKNAYNVKSSRIPNLTARTDKLSDKSGMDDLGFKRELELEVFGQSFDDSIHIQIAHAVFDIQKSLAAVIPNVLYTLNNLDRSYSTNDTNGKKDIIGNTLNYQYSYESFNVEKRGEFAKYYNAAKDRFSYFPDILCVLEKVNGKDRYQPKSEKDAFNVLSSVNMLRNSLFHFAQKSNDSKAKIAVFKNQFDSDFSHITSTVNKIYSAKIAGVNENFLNNEGNNLYIILNATNWDIKKIVPQLYRFSVLKSDKNMGFNMRKLREFAVESKNIDLSRLNDKFLTNNRKKLYKVIDFIIYYHLNKVRKDTFKDDIVAALRASQSEEEKEKLYAQYSERLFADEGLKSAVKKAVDMISDTKSNIFKKKAPLNKALIENIKVNSDASDFCKLIYVFTRFLDGKEINILLNSLIKKFQDIHSFNTTVKKLSENNLIINADYVDDYSLFEQSGTVAKELMLIKSISKMDFGLDNINLSFMYDDALRTLGVSDENLPEVKREYFGKTKNLSAYIRNNVLENRRFKYVIKYIHPSDVQKIACNKAIAGFVLNRMPDTQIKRYYDSLINKGATDMQAQAKALLDCITGISFDAIKDDKHLHKSKEKSPQRSADRERKKAMLTLYYTIVYIFVKQMLHINSLYTIGFFYLERDQRFIYSRAKKENKNPSKNSYLNDFRSVTAYFIPSEIMKRIKRNENKGFLEDFEALWNSCGKTSRLRKEDVLLYARYISPDHALKNYKTILNSYRNKIAHINVIMSAGKYTGGIKRMDSYFSVFQHLVQCDILSNPNNKGKCFESESLKPLLLDMKFDGTDEKLYSKRLTRALNIPFGYNVPRYKNLTFEKIYLKSSINE